MKRKPRSPSYGYDTVKVLQRVWLVADWPCGKCLVASMVTTLENMEAHAGTGEFGPVRGRYGPLVREQLLGMSTAV